MWRSVPAAYQKLAIAPQGYTDYLMATGKYAKDIYELGIDSQTRRGAIEPNPSSKEGVAVPEDQRRMEQGHGADDHRAG